MTGKSDIVIVVEDPGAANFVAELPHLLRQRGRRVHLLAGGAAVPHLRKLNVIAEPLADDPDAVLTTLSPCLLAIGTAEDPDSFGLGLVAAARARAIPTVGLVDSSTHLEFRFRGHSDNPLKFLPDTVIVPDSLSQNGFARLGVARKRIVVAGHPHWDLVRTTYRSLEQTDRAELRARLFKLPDKRRKVMLFAAEISTGMSPGQFQRSEEYTLTGRGTRRGRTEIVIEEFLGAVAPRRSELSLVLRLHPKQAPSDLSAYRLEFDFVSQSEASLEVVFASDMVVGMTSMLMMEAALMQRPTLAILPRAREAGWLPTIAAGITRCATTRGAVSEKVTALIDYPQRPEAVALDGLFPPGASQRVADTLDALLTPTRMTGNLTYTKPLSR
jgi:hypothetical protein